MKKIILFLIAFLAMLFLPLMGDASAKQTEVTDLRWTQRNDGNPPFVRIVMDLSQKVKAVAAMDSSGQNLEILLKDTQKGSAIDHDYSIYSKSVDFATAVNDGDDMRLDVSLNTPMKMKDIKVFALKPDAAATRPHRLVIDIPSISSAAPSTKAAASAKSPSTTSSKASSYTASKNDKKILAGKIICIDPGHGGSDVGAIGQLAGEAVYEKDITLSIAQPLRDMLTAAGAKVVMTRNSDTSVASATADDVTELQARCDIANKAKADAFISIHIDSFSNSSVDGTTAYYYPKTGNDLLLAQLLHQATLNKLAIPDRGVRSNDFYVNVHTNMPSTLLEMGFISNTHRVKMLTSSWGPKSIAQSIYAGLVDYFSHAS